MALSMPVELIEAILRYLLPRHLASILRVSHSLNRIATPLLYRDMELTLNPASSSLSTLLQRPDHAKLIHHAIIHLHPGDIPSGEMRKATSIISQMASLQELELHYRVGSAIPEFLQQIATSSFSQLRSFHLRPEPPKGPEDWEQSDISAAPVVQMADLPRVDELHLHGLVLGHKAASVELRGPLPVRRLTLKACQIGAPELALLLQNCPKLTWLSCEVLIDAEKARTWFDLSVVGESINASCGSLQHLHISFELATSTAIDTGNEGSWGIRSCLTSLKQLSQLRSLEVGFVTLLGWNLTGAPKLADVLPAGLERLTLTRETALWWGYQWDAVFEAGGIWSMIQAFLETTPCSLQELVLHVPEYMGAMDVDVSVASAISLKIIEDDF